MVRLTRVNLVVHGDAGRGPEAEGDLAAHHHDLLAGLQEAAQAAGLQRKKTRKISVLIFKKTICWQAFNRPSQACNKGIEAHNTATVSNRNDLLAGLHEAAQAAGLRTGEGHILL